MDRKCRKTLQLTKIGYYDRTVNVQTRVSCFDVRVAPVPGEAYIRFTEKRNIFESIYRGYTKMSGSLLARGTFQILIVCLLPFSLRIAYAEPVQNSEAHLQNIVETKVYSVKGMGKPDRQFVALLKEKTGNRILPIWIGECEARAIAIKLRKQDFPRPLTHDLLKDILEGTGSHVASILVDQVRPLSESAPGGTYFAVISLVRADGTTIDIDARPSDAMALAVRMGLSVFVSSRILEENGIENASPTDHLDAPASARPKTFY